MYETASRDQERGSTQPSTGLTNAWYQSCELLIEHGAWKNTYEIETGSQAADYDIFSYVFGSPRAEALVALMDEKEREQGKARCTAM